MLQNDTKGTIKIHKSKQTKYEKTKNNPMITNPNEIRGPTEDIYVDLRIYLVLNRNRNYTCRLLCSDLNSDNID